MQVAEGGNDRGRRSGERAVPLRGTSGEVRLVPGSGRLVSALDAMLQQLVDRPELMSTEPGISVSMRAVAADARGIGLHPEELLLLLKSSWRARPAYRRIDIDDADEERLSRLVTLCIKSYFADSPR